MFPANPDFMRRALRLLCLLCLWLPVAVPAQSPALVWHQIAGGGGVSQAGGCQLQGTIGQSEASGGSTELTAGYWNLFPAGLLFLQGTNDVPVAKMDTVARTASLAVRIFWANVATNWSNPAGGPVTLAGLDLVTTNGMDLLTNSTQIYYPATAPNVNDQIVYTITDGQGGVGTGYINIVVTTTPVFGPASSSPVIISAGASSVTVNFTGSPGFTFQVQRSVNLVTWKTIGSVTPAGAFFSYLDNFQDLGGQAPGTAYYRLSWTP